jgi:hypothetical protein
MTRNPLWNGRQAEEYRGVPARLDALHAVKSVFAQRHVECPRERQ